MFAKDAFGFGTLPPVPVADGTVLPPVGLVVVVVLTPVFWPGVVLVAVLVVPEEAPVEFRLLLKKINS